MSFPTRLRTAKGSTILLTAAQAARIDAEVRRLNPGRVAHVSIVTRMRAMVAHLSGQEMSLTQAAEIARDYI